MTDPKWCGEHFADPSWTVHREVMARLWDGDAHLMAPEYKAIARQLLGCEALPTEVPSEMYMGFGRGSGKTRFEAVAAVHAWAQDYRDCGLAAGAYATIPCVSASMRQAKEWLNYCRGFIETSPTLRGWIEKPTEDAIESRHFTKLEVFTNNFRTVRGFTVPLAIIDEASFLRDEFSSNPDVELRNALLPAMARLYPSGRLLVGSTLHRRAGLMWNMWRKHYGKIAA